ncbi:xanthine dehydrogenase family protein molybdopterin-binding subunit (plasmid) [Halococcus dombrowskii]|uniref:Molybdopterin-dependent oxidoreductase n=1 Tax=Halococcus dombrowskii TaxID=179637 RepID=A0AAV3SKS4_HALDO|nr:xanthine dehydrogenase family protein molybdopterin-binding subunit [Halococcus dombrowskii]UOO97021.1 xanthine dehydrogenase family protein molybdopterin-binding subunit [Halococcus dombrowskii]
MPIGTTSADETPGELVGTSVQRREDPRLLTGEARYTDDIQHPHTIYLAIYRSQYAHAQIENIDTSAAENHEKVLAVYTHDDLVESGIEGLLPADEPDYGVSVEHPILASETVRYQGQPIAGVVATERDAARDALDLIAVEYNRLDAAVGPTNALDNAPTVHEEAPNNTAFEWEVGDERTTDEAFEEAAHTVAVDLVNNRVIPTAMEPRAAVAQYRDDELIVEMSSQNPHATRRDLSCSLGIPTNRITVRVPDVGGGFGAKLQPYTGHVLAAWCAMQLERPVKWQATRTEDLASMVHGRHHHTTIEAALDSEGLMQAIRARTVANVGGYLTYAGSFVPSVAYGRMLTGQYDVSTAHVVVTGVFTNTAPLSAYRGAGRPEACYAIERLANAAAREMDMDPAEFRRRNTIQSDEFPYKTPLGHTYDSGDYEKTLDAALDRVDYNNLRERQEELCEKGRYLGIGLSNYVEACGVGPSVIEGGLVRMNPSGEVVAMTGTQDTGQGHATSFAQVVAETLGVDYDDVEIVEGDTDRVPEGGGTVGSRSLTMGGNALRDGAEKLVEKGRKIAAGQLEAASADLNFVDGEFRVAGAPERSVTIQKVARAAYAGEVPEGVEPGLEETTFFTPDGETYPFGTHVAVVEVEPDSGEITVCRYVAMDDVGTQINPKLVEGQIIGGVAQGVGQALYEGAEYDDTGNLLTGSFQDYTVPKAEHIPSVEWGYRITPSPNNPLGAKGVGEAGAIAAPPAVVNAVVDALSPLGVTNLDMPLTSETVWRAVEDARRDC